MDDLISVIVPIYNTQEYLHQCVDSIISQTYQNLEIILVDDGSSDLSGAICDEYEKKDKRIKVIHKKNGGMSEARNEGLNASNGNYIQFVDSDDFMDPTMIEVLYNNSKNYNAQISMCSHYTYIDGEAKSDCTGKFCVYSKIDALRELLMDRTIRSYAWNKLFAKSLFDEVRFPEGRVFEDIIAIPKLFDKANKLVLNDIPLYYYRQRNGSVLHVQTKELRLSYIDAVLEVQDYIRAHVKSLDNYCDYNLALATTKTFYDIGLFKMYDLTKEKKVQEMYSKMKKIFAVEEKSNFILSQVHNMWKIHFLYLAENEQDYILYNKYLPILFPEYESIVESNR